MNNHGDHISLSFLPKQIRRSLTNFQKKGIQFGIKMKGRVLIGDEMGLGKTLQAIAIAYYFYEKWPLLIIAPSSLRYNWVNELEDWLPFLLPGDINMIRSFADLSQMFLAKITIISYGLISISHSHKNAKVSDLIAKSNFGVVIVDESHFLKSMKTVRTKVILNSLKRIPHVILLSGTPSLSRPEELYPQLHLIHPTKFNNFHDFGERFCGGYFETVRGRGGQIFNSFQTRGASNLEDLNRLLQNVMIRRLKNEVLTELPSKRRSKIFFEIPESNKYKKSIDEQFKQIRKVLRQLKNSEDGFFLSAFDYNQPFNQLFCDTALAKAGAVQKYICDLIEGMPNKFLVFCFHMTMVQAIQETLVQKKIKYICITGSVPPVQRGHLVETFQSNKECRVAILSIQAASTGLTLTAADHVVFAELHHTPGVLLQAEDRCHRIGQKNAVQIHYLLAQGTIDEILWTMLQRKVMVTTAALNGKISEISMDEHDYTKKALLSMVDSWEPLTTLPAETSQLFEEKRHSKDIRFFLNKHDNCGKSQKRKKIVNQISCIDLTSDGEDFRSPKKKKVVAVSQSTPSADSMEEIQIKEKLNYESIVASMWKTHFKMENSHTKIKQKGTTSADKVKQKNAEKDITSANIVKEVMDNLLNLLEEKTASIKNVLSSDSSVVTFTEKIYEKPSSIFSISAVESIFISNTSKNIVCDHKQETLGDLKKVDTKLSTGLKKNCLEWSCSACTYLNPDTLNVCSICLNQKGKKNTEVLNEFIGDIDLDLCVHELQSNVSLSEKQNISALNIGCVNHDHTNNFILNKIITTEVSASVNGFINKESCEVPDSELIPAFSKEETINKENCKEIIESTNLLSNSMKDVFNTEKYNKMNESIELFSASEEENISEVNQVRKKENVEPISTFQENIELISTFQEKNFSSPTFDNRDVSKNESFIKSSICSNFNSFSFSGEDSILVEEDKVNELVADNLSDICKNHSPTKTMSYINKEIAEEGGNTVVVDEDVLKFFEDDFVIEDHLIANNDKLNDDDKSDVSEDEHNNRHYNFKFQMSFYTNKVYLYDDKEKFIQLKFNFQNISMGIIDDLHQILLLDHHFNQLKRFTKEWISLGPRKQLLVTKKGVIFSSPLDAYAALYNINNSKLKSFKRFTEKKNVSKIEKTAGNAGGKVIAVKRFSSGINKKSIVKEKKSIVNKKNPIVNEKNSIVKEKNPFVNENNLPAKESYKVDCGVLQAVDKQGIALCLYCEKQVEQIAAGSWLAQFCSHTCMQEFKIRSKSKHENAREQLFAVELGVCQMCGIDAHTVFLEISNMPIANRKAALEKTCFVKLSVPVLNKMIKHPKEGLFWQADHVLAVAEGGGECGLENYRTLCTPCHKVVTKDLMIRIKKVKPSHKETRSNVGISSYFKPCI
ncbi:DNA annealing helicase and endonuclease ZRANB3 isoform X5 [Hydra vulgaris]|uniref:DNA annealing helicase and endonuclease ZRANB3 isoform X5 n=1 Tax=Hydra vulgaris TaxID=6087 RepID=A0ABM4BRN3_HYDVU